MPTDKDKKCILFKIIIFSRTKYILKSEFMNYIFTFNHFTSNFVNLLYTLTNKSNITNYFMSTSTIGIKNIIGQKIKFSRMNPNKITYKLIFEIRLNNIPLLHFRIYK
jgi:hypothetical protein